MSKKPGLNKPCRLCRRKRTGAAAVEFALVAPVFFLMVLGMIEIGRAVMVQQVITNASREGARRAVLDGATAADVQNFVNTYLTNASLPSGTISFPQGNPENAGFGSPVEVRVSIPFSQVSWLPSPMYLGGENLEASTVMRRETVQ
ncbi:MAG: pilus assembly protein [Planctomycetota bacterium]|mgnify:CR=1 FL=1|nr:MAG: pilus assembly protein [Planctomycetota bacterium]REK17629.1 MAG: pilus assembly protein [Planctomycetota bacterium]REK18050.1 MAG: pilus assembly protein [Planctomycetota bacterium]REK42349.1 MAG: pilus assembly protein [Planctomycetota bacterium]